MLLLAIPAAATWSGAAPHTPSPIGHGRVRRTSLPAAAARRGLRWSRQPSERPWAGGSNAGGDNAVQERIAARLRAKNYIPTIEEQVALRWRIAQLRSEVDSAKREIGALQMPTPLPLCATYRGTSI